MAEHKETSGDKREQERRELFQGDEVLLHEEEDEDTDPLGRLTNQELATIYVRLPPDERKVYRELLKNYRVQDKLFGTVVPTYQQVRTVMAQAFPALPADNAERLAEAQHELLKEEKLREMCQRMGFEMLRRLAGETEPRVLEEEERPRLRFEPVPPAEEGDDEDSEEEAEEMTASTPSATEGPLGEVKQEPDVKPRLATQYASAKRLRRLLGGRGDCIVTQIERGGDPMSHFVEDDPAMQQVIELSSDEDLDDIEDLSDSEEATPVTREQLVTALKNLADSHRVMGERLDTLVGMTEDMTTDQVEETASEVAYRFQGCKGWQTVLRSYDPSALPLILAIGCRKYEEVETLKKRWDQPASYKTLAKTFRLTKRVIQDGCKGITYRKGKIVYPAPARGKKESTRDSADAVATPAKKPRRAQTTLVNKEGVP